ncbi:beta-glucosidase family protein [Levilactobacillus suantsaii]|uniref:Glycosyl hydrolase n=1 Tax=Levilactobacillus suantsaii TaxID=2292255 RepID=A0A4Q0VJ88_9LACO|nr:glycoside hydrolase family 3 C-terminal domain-containing protein [Levilactobacillus suantsaii]QMU08319.1 glycoside hydrolase family 3 C-terminal domain-containing protein [Levilactobacillus suantsaii]RXI78741.1 glycosyl hydrolase [Levilactobacillus suantsaii]
MANTDPVTLVAQLTLAEKAALVSGKDFWYTEAVKHANLPKIMMTDGPSGLRKQAEGADALGLNDSVQAINFPALALSASSFNRDLLQELGQHLGQAAKANQVSVLLGPGVNIKRSPLAGRNFEYFSEDPLVAGELGAAYVQGVQSQGVGVSVKHFAANNRENQRFTASSNVDERTLREIYLSTFERIVKKAQPASLMCSYNAINHRLNSQNKRLLTDILRNEWNFKGVMLSDWGAVADQEAALKAGLDLEMPGKGQTSTQNILDAVQDGRLAEAQLDRAVERIVAMVQHYPADQSAADGYDLKEQHQFARKVADESIVLLKNDQNVLPVQASDHLGVIGKLAAKPRYQAGGSSHVNAFHVTTPLEAIQAADNASDYAEGYALTDDQEDDKLTAEAVAVAKKADKVIFFAGVPEADESEGFDKTTIDLPANQTTLLAKIAAVNPHVIVVLQNGSAITMPWRDQVAGIVETYLAGEAVGEATWDVLSGAVNPSGHLAETFPLRLADTPAATTFNASPTDENYREGLFVGYRYYDSKQVPVLYPFGYGLSYTQFAYSDLTVQEQADHHVAVSLTVRNTGERAGRATPQLYVANRTSHIEKPAKELRGFTTVDLKPGESQTVTIDLSQRAFSWYNPQTQSWQSDSGDYDILVGQSVADIELQQTLQLDWGTNDAPTVTQNTYFSDILKRDDLDQALATSGLDKVLSDLTSSGDNAKLLENIPLRSAVMLGISEQQITQFIQLANQPVTD